MEGEWLSAVVHLLHNGKYKEVCHMTLYYENYEHLQQNLYVGFSIFLFVSFHYTEQNPFLFRANFVTYVKE